MSGLNDADVWRIDTFIVPPGSLAGGTCVVSGREGHHGADVMRVRAGDPVRLIDGEGEEALARVDSVTGGFVRCSISERRSHERDSGVSLTVAQALLKGRGFDEVVRRLSELGVASIRPLVTERAIGRVPEDGLESRLERWRSVAGAAVKQSRGVFLPEIDAPVEIAGLARRVGEFELALTAWEDEEAVGLIEALRGWRSLDGERPARAAGEGTHTRSGAGPRSVLLVVGPEGGLSVAEVELLRQAGATSVTVGRRVLKADWAAAAISAMISYEVGGLLS
jgi:16S rRNA (uracil1498-N3)-methyltransferase